MKKRKAKKARTLGKCSKPETMGKHYKRKSRKKMSEKQKKALAKGRQVLKHLRTGRQVSEPKEPLLIKEGFFMATKKRSKRRAKHATAKISGSAGGKRKRRKTRVRHVLMGGDPGLNLAGIGVDLAGLLAGAIGLSFVAGMVPIKNPKFKALVPILAGIAGLSFPAVSGNRFINRAALGSLAIGGYSLTKQLVPKLPLMGATDTAEGIGAAIENLPDEEKAILGILPEYANQEQLEYQGQYQDVMGETQMIEGIPGEMLGSLPGEMLGQDSGEMLGETEMIGAGEENDFE